MLSRLLAEPTLCAPKIRHCSLMGPALSLCRCLPNGQEIMLCLFVYDHGPCTFSRVESQPRTSAVESVITTYLRRFRWVRAKVFTCNKTSVGRALAFGCATRCHLSVHSLAMPRSGPDDASHGDSVSGY